jgi:hypothetical protein
MNSSYLGRSINYPNISPAYHLNDHHSPIIIIADQLIFHVRDHYRATKIYPSPFCFCFEKASHYVSTEIYASLLLVERSTIIIADELIF